MESDFQLQLLRAIIQDRQFLKSAHFSVDAEDFSSAETKLIASCALDFYRQYNEPIAGWIRTSIDDKLSEQKASVDKKKKVKGYLDKVLSGSFELIPVKALEDRVKRLKFQTVHQNAVEKIISAYEDSKFDVGFLSEVVEEINRKLTKGDIEAIDFFPNIDSRIERRSLSETDAERYPVLMIDPLDKKIKSIGRGHIGLFLAPWKSGKSLALLWVALAYAIQGLNVLHISLEDPREEVEDRLDAMISRLPIAKLSKLPKKLRRLYKEQIALIRGRIRIIDGTDTEWSLTDVERKFEELKQQEKFIADAIMVDYDDEIKCEQSFKGESARRFEFAWIYRKARKLAAKLNVIFWTAAQTGKAAEGRKIVTAKDTAEDISKIRKVFLAVAIGTDPQNEKIKHLYVAAHKFDRQHFGVDICCDFTRGMFYDREATLELYSKRKAKR